MKSPPLLALDTERPASVQALSARNGDGTSLKLITYGAAEIFGTNQDHVIVAGDIIAEAEPLTVTITGGARVVELSLEPGASVFAVSSNELPFRQNQMNSFQVTVMDAAGNVSDPAHISILHDNIPPVLTLTGELASGYKFTNQEFVSISGTLEPYGEVIIERMNPRNPAEALVREYEIALRESPNFVAPGIKLEPEQIAPVNHFRVMGYDQVGNLDSKEIEVKYDNTPPAVAIDFPASGTVLTLPDLGGGYFLAENGTWRRLVINGHTEPQLLVRMEYDDPATPTLGSEWRFQPGPAGTEGQFYDYWSYVALAGVGENRCAQFRFATTDQAGNTTPLAEQPRRTFCHQPAASPFAAPVLDDNLTPLSGTAVTITGYLAGPNLQHVTWIAVAVEWVPAGGGPGGSLTVRSTELEPESGGQRAFHVEISPLPLFGDGAIRFVATAEGTVEFQYAVSPPSNEIATTYGVTAGQPKLIAPRNGAIFESGELWAEVKSSPDVPSYFHGEVALFCSSNRQGREGKCANERYRPSIGQTARPEVA